LEQTIMNKKVAPFSLCFASALLAALPALAQNSDPGSASTQITLTGVAPNVCSLPAPNASGAATNATFSNNTVSFTQFLDPLTALVNPSTISLTFAGTMCNYNATVSLSSKNGGLVASDASSVLSDAGTFLQKVPYTASVNWGRMSVLMLDTSATGTVGAIVSRPAGGANAADLVLSLTTSKSQLPVVSGTFTDIVTIKVSPSL
jgi:hypothetical protein